MTLLVRADASVQMGTGHVMRCLALAQAWQEAGGTVWMAIAQIPPALAERLQAEGIQLIGLDAQPGSRDDARQTAALAHTLGDPWVVVDGYQFDGSYQQQLKADALRLLFFDDFGHAGVYCADLVLNQNAYAHEGYYPQRSPETALLLGADYALLRREFRQWQGKARTIPPVAQKLLITLGGADPDNVTQRVIEALAEVSVYGFEAVVVVGGSNPHRGSIEAAIARSPHAIQLKQNVTTMPELMAWADVAIAAGGSTAWELAFMGLPSVTITLADNQQAVVKALHDNGLAITLGWHTEVTQTAIAQVLTPLLHDAAQRATMSNRGRSLVDGNGVTRVIQHLQPTPDPL